MKRRLFKLVLFLLLGAVVNVGVAWSSAVWITRTNKNLQRTNSNLHHSVEGLSENGTNYDFWYTARYETNSSFRVISSWNLKDPDIPVIVTGSVNSYENQDIFFPSAESLVPNWAGFLRPDSVSQPEFGSFNYVVDARGWPLLSMWGGHKRIRTFGSIRSRAKRNLSEAEQTIPIRAILLSYDEKYGWGDHTSRLLPLSPLWPGFAINTILYAAILLLPFAPFQLRRYLRVKRGLCIKCGYDLRETSGGCPECGWGREVEE